MQSKVQFSFPKIPRTPFFIIGILFIVALGIRVYHINELPLDFQPTRQYRSAIIAKGYFFETSQRTPDWESKVAIINKDREGILEPPIMELLAFLGYRFTGAEHLWIPRMLSVMFWLGGGVFLYALTSDLISSSAASFSTAFYLFLPFGISASRSFQPDPLMVFAFLSSIFVISRYHIQPSRPRLAIAAALSALAIFVKPVCLFAIFGAFVLANISRQGMRRTLSSLNLSLFAIVSLLPTALFYVYGTFVAGFLSDQAKRSFIPSLYFSSDFWLGWLHQINNVVGYLAVIAALLGVLLFREGLSRALLVGLWIGYALFGLTFNYHIHTHNYYQLQFIPIVALSIAPIGSLIFSSLTQACAQRSWRLALLGVLLFASLLYISEVRWRLRSQDPSQVRVAQEIGVVIQHSTKTIFLAFAYGKPLEYHGGISGEYWPNGSDIRAERLRGELALTARERLDSLIMRFSPEYFIVTDFQEFESQDDLKQYLSGAFPIAEQTREYLIFDLRRKINALGGRNHLCLLGDLSVIRAG
jgi:hypothetical protein